jgi:putative ABC transport system substrate-binding protein
VELLGELIPAASRIAAISDPDFLANRGFLKAAEAAARRRGFTLQPVGVRGSSELPAVFATMLKGQPAGVIVLQGPILFIKRSQIIEFAAKRRLPTIFMWREGPEAGALGSYGPSLLDLWRRAATYTDKILKGAKPADLPVEQATTFELIINLKTAKGLGLTIPQSLLQRADKVIE